MIFDTTQKRKDDNYGNSMNTQNPIKSIFPRISIVDLDFLISFFFFFFRPQNVDESYGDLVMDYVKDKRFWI